MRAHRWVAAITINLTPEEAAKIVGHTSNDNAIGIVAEMLVDRAVMLSGPGCYECEAPYDELLANQPCPGDAAEVPAS